VRSFLWLLPLGVANSFCQCSAVSSIVLQILDLASRSPDSVLFLPSLLRVARPEFVAGAAYAAFSLLVAFSGPIAGRMSDKVGRRSCCLLSAIVQAFGAAFTANTKLYFVGLVVFSIGVGFSQCVHQVLFNSQFADEGEAQRFVAYLNAWQNGASLLVTVLGGVQPYWAAYAESAAFSLVGFCFVHMAPLKAEVLYFDVATPRQDTMNPQEQARARWYGFFCAISVVYFLQFFQFYGGAYMVFVKERVGPMGTFVVPPSLFLSLFALSSIVIAVIVAELYRRLRGVRFYTKFFVSFFWLTVANGTLVLASAVSSTGKVNPIPAAAAIISISIADLHYNPVMLAAICTDMPACVAGLFTGIHFMLTFLGAAAAGLGVPLYAAIGPEAYFGTMGLLAALGMLCLWLASSHVDDAFQAGGDSMSSDETQALMDHKSKRRH